MRPYLASLPVFAVLFLLAASPVSACKCGNPYHGKTNWETAKLETEGSAAVFEGTPERFELRGRIFDAKIGDVISADAPGLDRAEWPHMLITFRVQRSYKGELGAEVQIKTGVGGGDCGAIFAPGLTYLVFAHGESLSDLSVVICSPGGWIDGSNKRTELRYLRNERPLKADLVVIRPLNTLGLAKENSLRQQEFQDYISATGKICGKIIAETAPSGYMGILAFLSTAGYSPAEYPTANIEADGSFCSGPLGPSTYYLHFMRSTGDHLASAIFYPGVSEKSKATTIDVKAGQTQSGVLFNVPRQKSYAVRGLIFADDKLDSVTPSSQYSVAVSLIEVGGGLRQSWYSTSVRLDNPLALSRVKYFSFEDVLPGRYIAFVSIVGQSWYTKKEEITVTDHAKFITLELTHKK
jgi:hypothetical protein